ncbi:M10 family metallopeptidase C-terminal domain-containing protein [Loktanella sp. DJP18]|uniref:M10 family metallopeptidase C-terminal domain-containing protein n=1 Tax=Loktanella sp. DJP18 TaxID=3409788 RepID=UPI003BB543DC
MSGNFNFTPAPAAPLGPLEAIVGNTALANTAIRVYFGEVGENFDEYTTGEGFTAYERARFTQAFAQIEAVADITFEVVTRPNTADFRLVLDTNEMQPFELGYFYPPGSSFAAGVGVFNGNHFDRFGGGNLEPGGNGAATVMHELLHGLGVMHPHDGGAGSNIMPGVTSDFDSFGFASLNQGIFTTMSYNRGYHTGRATAPVSDQYGHQSGPMALDIAALQLMYGPAQQADGNTVYRLPEANGIGTGWQAIWDTGGVDRIVYDGRNDATIDLRAAQLSYIPGGGGFVSAAEGIKGGFTIAEGVTVEQAFGGSGQDRVIGNEFANTLLGRNGNDVLYGLNGPDILKGGYGNDILRGGSGNDRLNGKAGDDRLVGGHGSDLLHGGTGHDRLQGNAGNDRLVGGHGSDLLHGGNGHDRLQGNAGNDRLVGGHGSDLLHGGTGHDRLQGNAGNDRLVGGHGSDLLHGGNGNDRLQGHAGNDRLIGGHGSDVLHGGFGDDTFIYNRATDSLPTASHRDVISDFTRGIDRISFAPLDGHLGRSGNQAFEFIGRAGFDGDDRQGDVRIHHLAKGGVIVAVDQNGDGYGDMQILVQGIGTLSVNDFIL